ncbi:TraR/DksA C4-type zinc finger protein [Salmonella enterica]|nr:TraR/DksA C4-type zinc finger protein [Salmonella enterica]EIR3424077.1 TraR/DksA C4-type zinc finger protein [Salmonella enterica]
MADVLDQLQEQEDLIHRLHIQAVRQQLSIKGESLTRCECCGNRIQERRQKAIPGVRTCTECQRVLEIREKNYQR